MEPNYTVEQHIALKRVTAIAPAPDGTWLAVAVQRLDREGTKYVSDLWKVPTDGSAPLQLTRGDCKDTAPCFRRADSNHASSRPSSARYAPVPVRGEAAGLTPGGSPGGGTATRPGTPPRPGA